MLTLLLACSPAPSPPPPPEVAVEVRWPGASPAEVEQGALLPVEEALSSHPELRMLRCEAISGAGRCLATLETPDLQGIQAAVGSVRLPEGVDPPTVWLLPPVAREARWLVLSGAPVDQLLAWHPGTWVASQWPARCNGEPAVALELAADPTAPPPATASVRMRKLGPDRVHVSGPDSAALDRVDTALDGLDRCLSGERGRLDGWVLAPATEVRARLSDPEIDVVPGEATSRRYRAEEQGAAELVDTVRALPGVLTVRAQLPRTEPQVEVSIDRDEAARLGLTAEAITAAIRGAASLEEVRVGEVPLSQVATITISEAPAVLLRVDRERAVLLDVILARDAPEVRRAVDAAVSPATPLEPWDVRLQRP